MQNLKFESTILIIKHLYEKGVANSIELSTLINQDASVVRYHYSRLKKLNIIAVKSGPGGAALIKNPTEISALELYELIKPNPRDNLEEKIIADYLRDKSVDDLFKLICD